MASGCSSACGAHAAVAVLDLAKKQVVRATWQTESHPTEMAAFARRQAAVRGLRQQQHGVGPRHRGTASRRKSSPAPCIRKRPTAARPTASRCRPTASVLFIANADNNNVAVFDVSERGKSRSLGYHSGRLVSHVGPLRPDEQPHLRRQRQGADVEGQPQGPQPPTERPAGDASASTSAGCSAARFERDRTALAGRHGQVHASWRTSAARCRATTARRAKPRDEGQSDSGEGRRATARSSTASTSSRRTAPTIRSSATCRRATATPTLCIFPEKVTPNHHALAREFVLLDNFYVESEVSADGHEWSMAAYATDFVEKTWPLVYRGGTGQADVSQRRHRSTSPRRPAVTSGIAAQRPKVSLPQLWRVHRQRRKTRPTRPRPRSRRLKGISIRTSAATTSTIPTSSGPTGSSRN